MPQNLLFWKASTRGHFIWSNGPSLRTRRDRGITGQRSGQDVAEVDALVEQQEATLDLEAMDAARARAVLHLDAEAPLPDAEAAFRAYADEYDPDRFLHLGVSIADHAARRLATVTRAIEVLRAQ